MAVNNDRAVRQFKQVRIWLSEAATSLSVFATPVPHWSSFITLVNDHIILQRVGRFFILYILFQEVYTGIVSALMLHADEKTVSLLNTDALPSSLNMLKQGPW